MTIRPPLNYRPPEPDPPEKKGYRSPSRIGKRAAVAWLEPESVKQLNMMAIQRDTEVGVRVAAEQKLRLAMAASRDGLLYGGKQLFSDAPTPTPM